MKIENSIQLSVPRDISRLGKSIREIQSSKRVGLFSEDRITQIERICHIFFELQPVFDLYKSRFSIQAFTGTTSKEYDALSGSLVPYLGPSTICYVNYHSKSLYVEVTRFDREHEIERRDINITRIELAFSNEEIKSQKRIFDLEKIGQTKFYENELLENMKKIKPLIVNDLVSTFRSEVSTEKTEITLHQNGLEIKMYCLELD